MGGHWSEAYVGQPYVLGEADCARLVCRVRAEVFGGAVPAEEDVDRAVSAYGRAVQMADGVALFTAPVAEPEEGDVVLMMCRGRPSHVGAFCRIAGEPAVLHAVKKPGQAVLTRLRDLGRMALSVEGFYRWK